MNVNPNSIVMLNVFMHLCEVFLGQEMVQVCVSIVDLFLMLVGV